MAEQRTLCMALAALLCVASMGCSGEVVPHASDGIPNSVPIPGMDGGAPPPPPPPPPTNCGSATEIEVIHLANSSRSQNGAGSLTCDPVMAHAARLHSEDMCAQGYFDHVGLDGRDPFDRMRDLEVVFRSAAENIAQGQQTPASVHNAWMNSSGHRRNLLNGSYGRIGVGLSECRGRMYWTQVFAN